MLYEVRVFGKDGSLKKKISAKTLSRQHWKAFNAMEESIGLLTTAAKPVP